MRISDWSSDVCSSDLGQVILRVCPVVGEQDGRCSRCRQLILGEAGCRDREVAPQHLREQVLRCLDQGHLVRRPLRKKSHLVAQRLGEERPDNHLDLQIDGPEKRTRSEEHTSELQSLMRLSYAVFCLKQQTKRITPQTS